MVLFIHFESLSTKYWPKSSTFKMMFRPKFEAWKANCGGASNPLNLNREDGFTDASLK